MTITQRSRRPHRRRAGLAVVAVVALALVGAACGDDDDDTAADGPAGEATETTEAAEAGAASAAGGDTAAFCDARVSLEQAFAGQPPDVQAITGLLDDLQAAAPTDLAASVEGLSTVLTAAAESGTDPAEDPAFVESLQPVDEVALDQCGYDTVDVTGLDYSFEGLPETIEAGTTAVKLTNEGAEPHVIVVFKINEGDDISLDELLALPEDQVAQHATFAFAAQAAPGTWGASFVELEPGRYAAFCPIPVGESGPPHFMEGMADEFEVS